MGKIITIVIPTYNMEKYLHKCLDSLIVDNKLMDTLEVLIINDGSKDTSLNIARNYEKRYPQTFKVIDKENGNYGSCVNRGIKEALGKYVKILDADDSFETDVFSRYLEDLSCRDEDLIITDFIIVDEEGHYTSYDSCKWLPERKTFSVEGFSHHLQMHNITYKLENLRKIGYQQTEGISYTDREWAFWPMTAVRTIYYMPISLYLYLVGRQGQTMDEKVYIMGVDQEILITKKMVELWTSKHDDFGKAEAYINNTICSRLRFLIWGDIDNRNGVNQAKYIEMDKFLKSNYPDFYAYSSDHTVLANRYPYHFLRVWRKNYHLSAYNPYILLFKLLNKIVNHFFSKYK